MHTAPMHADRPTLGIALMLLFCLLAPLADALAKMLGDSVPLLQVVAVRFVAQAVLLVPLVLALGGVLRVPRGLWPVVVLRTLLHVVGIALMFLSLRFLPLADAIAIAYIMPFLVLIVGGLVLGEEVGWRRALACAAGFAGTLMVLQPSLRDVGAPALLPLGVAVAFAAFMLLTRKVARAMGPLELQAVNGLIGSALLVPLSLLAEGSGHPELDPVMPDAHALWLLAGIGALGTGAHLALTWSLRFAPAATVAPMQYLEIPFAVLLGLLLFAELPGPLSFAGIALVMAAGLVIILREQRLAARGPRPEAPPPQPPGPPAA
ncbi:MAG: DMT family transporter [Paracoccaceae bacterium]|jgi:drug/metabolite transporter (DMT)-like permease|nr:DMT family transporter [Paracoccaceae bacterium]